MKKFAAGVKAKLSVKKTNMKTKQMMKKIQSSADLPPENAVLALGEKEPRDAGFPIFKI